MAGWANKLKHEVLGNTFRAETPDATMFIALIDSSFPPDADTDAFSEINEITAGNGYTLGGIELTKGNTDFDTWTQDDANNRGLVQIRNVVWTASGGPIPSAGDPAYYAILVDPNVTTESRALYAYWSLASDRTVSDGQTLTLEDCEIQINEA